MPRPRKFWLGYLLSVMAFVAAGWCTASFGRSIFSLVTRAGGQRALMPGEAVFELEAGDYDINYDNVSHIDGRPFESPPLTDRWVVSCRLVNIETGQDVPLDIPSGRTTYSVRVNDQVYTGERLLAATIADPGIYELHGEPLPGRNAGKSYVLAVEKSGFGRKVIVSVLTLMVGVVLGLAGLVGLIITIVMHVSHRNKCAAYVLSGDGR